MVSLIIITLQPMAVSHCTSKTSSSLLSLLSFGRAVNTRSDAIYRSCKHGKSVVCLASRSGILLHLRPPFEVAFLIGVISSAAYATKLSSLAFLT